MTDINSLKMKAGVQYSGLNASETKILDEKTAKILNKAIIEAAKQDGNKKDLSEAEAKYIMEQMGIDGDPKEFMQMLKDFGSASQEIKSSKLDKSTGERTNKYKNGSQTFGPDNREISGVDENGFPYTTTYDDEAGAYTRVFSASKKGINPEYTSLKYDTDTDQIISSTDSSGIITKYSYNEQGSLLCEERSSGVKVHYEYCSDGKQLSTTTYEYANGETYTKDRYDYPKKRVNADGSYEVYSNHKHNRETGELTYTCISYDKNGIERSKSTVFTPNFSTPEEQFTPESESKSQPKPNRHSLHRSQPYGHHGYHSTMKTNSSKSQPDGHSSTGTTRRH